jgi:hypothetical protein
MTASATSTIVQPAASEASVIKGREVTPKPRQSRAAKSAARNAATAKPKPVAKPKTEPKTSEPTPTQQRDIVFAALMTAAGQIVADWDKSTGVSRETARTILAQRLRYTPGQTWDSRLGARVNIDSRTGKS